jgi:mycofactocin precursor
VDNPTVELDAAPAAQDDEPVSGAMVGDDMVDDELLVEEISIDGMCGVY